MSESVMNTIKSAADRPDDQTIASQLAKPSGELGLKIAEKMNEVNRFITELVYDAMSPRADDRILEVGFGNGRFLRDLAKRVPHGRIDGIDISTEMVQEAEKLLSDLIAADKVDVQYGSIEEIPFDDGLFDHVCSMNTIYFWPNPARAMAEVFRVLKPGGKLVLGLRRGETMAGGVFDHGFRKYEVDDVTDLFVRAGFKNVDHFIRDERHLVEDPTTGVFDNIIVWGVKS